MEVRGPSKLWLVRWKSRSKIGFAFQEGKYKKFTGVNRILVLAEVEGGQEQHNNDRQILERLKLHKLPGLIMGGGTLHYQCIRWY